MPNFAGAFAAATRVTFAFLYGVLLGIMWECASMLVLLAATLVEHVSGMLVMLFIFAGLAGAAFSVASRAGACPVPWKTTATAVPL